MNEDKDIAKKYSRYPKLLIEMLDYAYRSFDDDMFKRIVDATAVEVIYETVGYKDASYEPQMDIAIHEGSNTVVMLTFYGREKIMVYFPGNISTKHSMVNAFQDLEIWTRLELFRSYVNRCDPMIKYSKVEAVDGLLNHYLFATFEEDLAVGDEKYFRMFIRQNYQYIKDIIQECQSCPDYFDLVPAILRICHDEGIITDSGENLAL